MNTEFRGTKGDWKINNYSGNTDCVYSEQTQERIATYHKKNNKGCYSNSSLICEANAQLIATAPELLEALIEITNSIDNSVWNHPSLEKGKQAIKKALNP